MLQMLQFTCVICLLLPGLMIAGAEACTPIYPECACKTQNLQCETIESIRLMIAKKLWGLRVPGNDTASLTAGMEALKADPAHKSLDAANFVGGIVRLAWHDAAEFDPESADNLRADGCVDLSNTGNAGLAEVIKEVDVMWKPFCSKISRADFWVLIAKTVIEESTSYVASEYGRNVNAADGGMHGEKKSTGAHRRLIKGDAVLENYVLPFSYGRVDVKHCEVVGTGRLPGSERAATEIETYIMKKFNMNARHAVALLGAHTLGRCDKNNSGYNSTWKDRGDLFTTAYFKLLLVGQWKRAQMVSPHDKSMLFQWNHVSNSDREQWAMMLASDMQLVYAIDPQKRDQEAFAISCGPLDKEASKKDASLKCPTTSSVYPLLPFDTYTKEFAEGDTASHDEPGASKWLVAFAEAFRMMTEAGYADTQLSCPSCPPKVCINCPQQVLCGSGVVYRKDAKEPIAPIGVSTGGYTYNGFKKQESITTSAAAMSETSIISSTSAGIKKQGSLTTSTVPISQTGSSTSAGIQCGTNGILVFFLLLGSLSQKSNVM